MYYVFNVFFSTVHSNYYESLLTLFRIQGGEGWQKKNPTDFSSAISTNVRIIPKNFLPFSFNTFITMM